MRERCNDGGEVDGPGSNPCHLDDCWRIESGFYLYSAVGLLPLLLPIVLNVALIWYASYLDEHGRLGA